MKKKIRKVIPLAIVGFLIIGMIVGYATHFFEKAISSLLYDNRNHYLSCDELPTVAQVEQIMAEHEDTIEEIKQVNPEFISVYMGTPCEGKGEIIIEYPSHANRERIEAIIGSETFFGIPFRGINY